MSRQDKNPPSLVLLWLVGVFQPVSPDELHKIVGQYFEDYKEILTLDDIKSICWQYEFMKCFVKVHKNPNLYSLTLRGNKLLSIKARLSRDKARFYLLNQVRHALITKSCVSGVGLGDVASSANAKSGIEGSESIRFASFVPRSQTLWTRYSEQFSSIGNLPESQDTSFAEYLSFYSRTQFLVAKGLRKDSFASLDIVSISLMLGISGSLIGKILRDKDKFYGNFKIRKKSGGIREINAPRVFLKVIQRFLLDYYLIALPTHSSVHSFTKSKSIADNARIHAKKKIVGTIDIENYFGSITEEHIIKLLKSNKYDKREAKLIADICTNADGVLPQGAPTSPMLSNALLFSFDEAMSKYANESGLTYSRYADDLTISGDDKSKVHEALEKIERELRIGYSLKINKSKKRIVSFRGRQIVTGLVVNEKVQPPRKKRHQIRAAFHNASKKDSITTEELNELRGHYGYLHSIPENRNKKEMKEYKYLLTRLAKKVSD